MSLHELAVRRHVLAYMMSGVLVLFGVISYQGIGVGRFPDIDFPVVSITTAMPGADPKMMDASVTDVIESAVNTTPGIHHIESGSSPSTSAVNIQFDLDKDIDVAFSEVQSKVSQIRNQLPDRAEPPVVDKVDVGASPIMWLSLQGNRTRQQLNQYARNNITNRLESLDGVGEIRQGGRRERTIRVNLDPARMAAYGVTPTDLVRAFDGQHVQFPGGFLVGGPQESLMDLDLEYHSVEGLASMVVAHRDGAPVRVRDIGEVTDGLADKRQLARFNGEYSVGLGVVKISGANTVAVVDEVKRELDTDIRPNLPPGMELSVAFNEAELVEEIIAALEEHLLMGTLLAALVVYLFLRSFRSTVIIATAIPVSLLGAVAVMYFAGYTFNQVTMLALLLLIGVVVDDAIVVLENIHRHSESLGRASFDAAIAGTDQVVFAVAAASLTLVSIFAPVIFMGGIIGRFFESFAVVVTVGILVSLFVSLTLTPMLCSRFLVVHPGEGRIRAGLERGFQGLENAYRSLLGLALRWRWLVIGLALAVSLSAVLVYEAIGKEFTPPQDEGHFLVSFETPLGSSIEHTEEKLQRIEATLADHEAVRSAFTAIGLGREGQVNKGMAFVRMTPREHRDIRQQDLMPILRREFSQLPGVKAFANSLSITGAQRGEPLQFFVTGDDLQRLGELTERLEQRLKNTEGMGQVDTDLQLDLPRLELNIDRTRAAELGVSPRQIGQAISILAGGADLTSFNEIPGDGRRYDVRLKADSGTFETPRDLSRIYLRSKQGELVRLDSVAEPERTVGPATITRFDLDYGARFFINPEISLNDAIDKARGVAGEVLPPGYRMQLAGQAESFQDTMGYIGFAFVVGVILVYMVLASQFNSFLQPLIVMVAQPLAIIGGIVALWLMGDSLNIYSMIGLLLLMGLVAKNSILLVDLTNQLREAGRGIDEALREACPIRLRPVLMTSVTVILALAPAAVGLGAGSDTNGPLAIAVIGGMISSTALTLVVVPAVYSLLEGFLERHGLASVAKHGSEQG